MEDGGERGADGRWTYNDERMRQVDRYLTEAELTQAAHRNRPLRHDGRIVLSFCDAEVRFLPITTEVVSLPQLTADGEMRRDQRAREVDQKLRQAAGELVRQGQKVTVRALIELTHLDRNAVTLWLRTWREGQTREGNDDDGDGGLDAAG